MTKESEPAAQETIPPGADLSRRLGSFVGGWIAAWWYESDHDDGSDVDPSALAPITTKGPGSSPEPFQRSSLISPASIGSAIAVGLAVLLVPRCRRRIDRLRGGRARAAGLAVRPGSWSWTGREEGLP
jgi:hypothetical protein